MKNMLSFAGMITLKNLYKSALKRFISDVALYNFPGPSPFVGPLDGRVVDSAVKKLQNSKTVTEEEAHGLLDWLVREANAHIYKKKSACMTMSYEDLALIECDFVQSMYKHATQEIGLDPKVFAVDPETLGAHWTHMGCSIELPLETGKKTYLIDPTFRQFCSPESCNPKMKIQSPGLALAREENGKEILNSFLANGYIELTPSFARKYLRSFCNGKDPFDKDEEALNFLKNPPDNTKNHLYTKSQLVEDGYFLEFPQTTPII